MSRTAALSLGVLGVMGAMLAVTGIFGMAAYSVSKRLRELGIRMALGAQRGEILPGRFGTLRKIAGCWIRRRTAPGNSGEPGARVHRISGQFPRSYGVSRCCPRDGFAGITGYLDSGTTRTVG